MAGQRDRAGGAGSGGRRDRQQQSPVDRGVRGRLVAVDDVAEQRGQVGIGVEAEDGIGFGQGWASSDPYRSARQPTATTLAPVSAAASTVSMESFLALATNAQVFTTTTSAAAGSATSS